MFMGYIMNNHGARFKPFSRGSQNFFQTSATPTSSRPRGDDGVNGGGRCGATGLGRQRTVGSRAPSGEQVPSRRLLIARPLAELHQGAWREGGQFAGGGRSRGVASRVLWVMVFL